MNINLLKLSKNFWFVCFIISLLMVIKLFTFDWLALSLGTNFHKPVSYIRQPIDMWKTGLIQQYQFKNRIRTQYNIDVKIISSGFNPYGDVVFDGEYKISIFNNKKTLIKEIFAANDISRKDWFKIYVQGDSGGMYYVIYEDIPLSELSDYILTIENLKGLSTHENAKFELVVSPLEYNERAQKRNFIIKLIIWISISILSSAKLTYFR